MNIILEFRKSGKTFKIKTKLILKMFKGLEKFCDNQFYMYTSFSLNDKKNNIELKESKNILKKIFVLTCFDYYTSIALRRLYQNIFQKLAHATILRF